MPSTSSSPFSAATSPSGRSPRFYALALRKHWLDRVVAEEVRIDTANKSMGHFMTMFHTVNDHHQLLVPDHFQRIRIKGDDAGARIAYEPSFVQRVLLAVGVFDGLNEEARRIVYLIAETGLRLSEACNLLPHHIHLDVPIPYIEVIGEDRKLKTKNAKRTIPLVGCALMAMQAQPNGFPRYRDNADALSALVNKFLATNGLSPNGETLYSLRHCFDDRLTHGSSKEKTTAKLMGHTYYRPDYGNGPQLELKLAALKEIAFVPPSRL